jgi:alpha-ribazole phosphatase/probable phosphoglycerate mutase
MRITYFVHTTTTDNEAGLATGWIQGELSENGLKQASSLSKTLYGQSFDAIFTSDLHRAIKSTELFFENRFPVFIDWRLRECNYGIFDGKPVVDFKKDREVEFISAPYENGESYEDVERRISSFLNDLRTLPFDHIAIVAHQAPQLALDVLLKGRSWKEAIAEDWRKTKSWQPGWEYLLLKSPNFTN